MATDPTPRRERPAKTRATGITLACLLFLLPVHSVAQEAAAQEAVTRDTPADEATQTPPPAPRPIAAGQSWWLEELTSMEIRDRVAAGATTVIIPTGGIEENGPYLATGKHNLILQSVCPAIAARLGNALCAPIVKFVPQGDIDPPSGAMRFPGSISLSAEVYEGLLTDIAASLRQAGFADIVLIGDSGGNQAGMARVADRLSRQWGDSARIHFIGEFYDPGWAETERYTEQELGIAETRHDGFHDDIWVTAMMMVADPNQVRHQQRLEAGLASINGVSIADLAATVELGQKMIAFRAAHAAKAIRGVIEAGASR